MQPFHWRSATKTSKTPYPLRTHEQPLAAEHQGRTDSTMKQPPAAPAAHTRYLSSLAAATSHGKHTVSAPASFQHNPHATCMQPLQCVLQHHVAHPHLSTHMGNKDVTPILQLQNTKGEPIRRWNSPKPHPPHTRGNFHRWPQPLYTEKDKVSCSGFLQHNPHATCMQPLQCVFASAPP